jgi:serine/threonine protein kinase
MAVVHLGTMVSPAGERTVAIKQVLSKDETDQTAPARIAQEARLVFLLTHANICQVIDLATNEGGTFIVMEYVDGVDLRTLVERLARAGRQLDVPCAVHAIREVAQALDYAHRRADENGRPLRLVHGDVTPQNILISREGEVKLADFGIARALGVLAPGNQLRGGTPGFIAPETLTGNADHRADIYALGVSLYVALSGKNGRSLDLAALRTMRPEMSGELLGIIERATRQRPAERFASAAELDRALSVFLARHYPDFTASALADLVRGLAPAKSSGPASEQENSMTLFSMTRSENDRTLVDPAIGEKIMSVFDRDPTPSPRQTQTNLPSPPRRTGRVAALGVVVAIGALALGLALRSGSREPVVAAAPLPSPPPAAASIPTPSTPAPEAPAPPSPAAAVPAPAAAAILAPAGPAKHARPRPPVGYLSVNSVPWGAVFVDGKKVASETPVYRLPVSIGKHRVTIFDNKRGVTAPPQDLVVEAGQTRVVGFHF